MQTDPEVVYQFGPFELNTTTWELLKHGRRIKLQEQPSRLLVVLLENAGEVITREELRSRLWPHDTFVDFDGSLRVAIRKLREALNDDADDPRYIETIPKRGYRFLVPEVRRVEAAPVSMRPEGAVIAATVGPAPAMVESGPTASAKPQRRGWLWVVVPCAALIFYVISRRVERPPATGADWKLTQLTAAPGTSNTSAISQDGKLVAYSSDRAKEGQFDLYVKQVAGGDPIRLTFDGSNNSEPDFSPDGSRIVFRSNRDGGGIFVMPALGGEARLLSREGLDPKFSPDGTRVAYWVGERHVAPLVPWSATVWVMPAAGGPARKVGAALTAARLPIWAPDGAHLLVVGYTSTKNYDAAAMDWWVVPVDGGPGVRAGLYEALKQDHQQGPTLKEISLANPFGKMEAARPSCWIASTNHIIFSNPSGDALNIWETEISPATGRVTGVFTRLTTGEGSEWDPSCASDSRITFTNSALGDDVWELPFDLDKGRPTGAPRQLTNGVYVREGMSLSRDGRTMAFSSNQTGPLNIWMRQAGGRDFHMASPLLERYPMLNPPGDKVAFSSFEGEKRTLYVATPGQAAERVCDDCLRATDWSRDGKDLLVFSNSPYQVNLLNLASRQETPLLRRAGTSVLYGRFSPDNRWVSFTMRLQPDRSWIMIAPIDGQRPVPEEKWIKIAEGGLEDWANWSPDGKTLYFTSARDGFYCLWGQRIDPVSHHPTGEPFAVHHFHGRAAYRQGGWMAAGGRIAILLRDGAENVWMMSRGTAH